MTAHKVAIIAIIVVIHILVVVLVVNGGAHRGRKHHEQVEEIVIPPCPTIPPCPNCPNCTCPQPPGGILANCTLNTQCSNGLICQSGQCICPPPAAPTVTVTRSATGVVSWSWPAVVGADSYNIIVSGPCYTNEFFNQTATSGSTVTSVCAGTYTVSVQANTANCGSGPFASSSTPLCASNTDCPIGNPTCNVATGVCH